MRMNTLYGLLTVQWNLFGVPPADLNQENYGGQRCNRKPRHAPLAVGQHNERGKQWPKRRAGIAAHLKHALRQTMLASGSHMRDARRFRMEYGRPRADQRRRNQ